MATTKYTISTNQINIAEYENYSEKDQALIDSFKVNSVFDINSHFIELHIYSLDNRLLHSDYSYTNHKQLLNSESAGKDGATNLYIDPVKDTQEYGFEKGGVKLLYHYLSNIFSLDNSRNFYIETISPDRTEIRLLSTKFSNEDLLEKVSEIKTRFSEDPYFNEFRLNFGKNDLLIGINIDTEEYGDRTAVLIKLYEPLPEQYVEKDILYIVERVSDSTQYTVDSTTEAEKPQSIKLRGPNFDLEEAEENVLPTEFLSYNDLYSFPVTSSNSQLLSMMEEKSIRLSIDYSDFNNFIKFSSAEERLRNFAYKVNLLNDYETELSKLKSSTANKQPVSGSTSFYENSIKTILANFDSYEKYLYFETGSHAWPKATKTSPYVNQPTASATTWFDTKITSASLYDLNNPSALRYTMPEFLKDNPDNEPASIFLDMLGHHFDNIWLYADAVTEKYNADNRIDRGISRDLVEDALKNFGVKLYTSNFSTSDLYNTLITYTFDPGCEQISNLVTVSEHVPYFVSHSYHDDWRFTPPAVIEDIAYNDYRQEILKRIYHNLPLLLKTKGTNRGIRALINCFGIPKNILTIEEYGGVNREQDFYYGYQIPFTSSLDKIRLDNTGSIVGTTLSNLTSIQQPAEVYNQDLHPIEVGFSPTTNINNYIVSQSAVLFSSWSLDQYIGDPLLRRERSYQDLDKHAKVVLADVTRYDVFDFVRLIKFFDNTLFKMIKDFTPARATTTTGIIIKPHALDRSKIQSPVMSWTRPEYTASIDTAFIQGSEGGVISASLDTTHAITVNTLTGSIQKVIADASPLYNGEFGGTELTATTQSLNIANTYVEGQQPIITYNITRTTEQFLPASPIGGGPADVYPGANITAGTINVRYWEIEIFGFPITYEYNLRDAKISKRTSNGVDVNGNLDSITKIYIQNQVFEVESIQEFTDHYYVNFRQQNNITRVTAGTDYEVNFSRYVDKLFYFSDYNVLLNNSERSRLSDKYFTVDRFSDIIPQNILAINNSTAEKAQVQDSNYSSLASSNIKYNGVEHQAFDFNSRSSATSLIPVERNTPYFCVFDYISGYSPEHNEVNAILIKYIVNEEGNVLTPDTENAQTILEQGFASDSTFTISIDNADIGGTEATLLGDQISFKGGQRIEPIIYSYTASIYLSPVYYGGNGLQFSSDPTLRTYDFQAIKITQQLLGTNFGDITEIEFDNLIKDDRSFYDGTSRYVFGEDTEQPVRIYSAVRLAGTGYIDSDGYEDPLRYIARLEASTDGDFSNINTTSVLATDIVEVTTGNSEWAYLITGYLSLAQGTELRIAVENDGLGVNRVSSTGTFNIYSEQSGSQVVYTGSDGYFFTTSSNADNYWLTASADLSSKYDGSFEGVEGSLTNSGFNTVTKRFLPLVGDEIKFNGREDMVHYIAEVESPEFSVDNRLYLRLGSRLTSFENPSFFVIRRYLPTSNMVLMKTDKVAGTSKNGLLYPKYPSKRLRENFEKIIEDLKTKQII